MPKQRMATLDDLLVQLKLTNSILAAQLGDRMKQNEIVVLLASTGASNQAIAEVLGTTPATVNMTLHRNRKKRATASGGGLG